MTDFMVAVLMLVQKKHHVLRRTNALPAVGSLSSTLSTLKVQTALTQIGERLALQQIRCCKVQSPAMHVNEPHY